MGIINVERNPSEARLKALGVAGWPIWSHPVATFPWTYGEQEICLLLEGEVIVTPTGEDEGVMLGAGDLVTFPAGLSCTWKILQPVRKHYNFGALEG